MGGDDDLGPLGRLVRIVDTREVRDIAATMARVQPFTSRVAQTSTGVETQTSTNRSPWRALVTPFGTERSPSTAVAVARQQVGNDADAPHVLLAVGAAEHRVRGRAAQLVAVEQLGARAVGAESLDEGDPAWSCRPTAGRSARPYEPRFAWAAGCQQAWDQGNKDDLSNQLYRDHTIEACAAGTATRNPHSRLCSLACGSSKAA